MSISSWLAQEQIGSRTYSGRDEHLGKLNVDANDIVYGLLHGALWEHKHCRRAETSPDNLATLEVMGDCESHDAPWRQ